jgi:hypothetical protein
MPTSQQMLRVEGFVALVEGNGEYFRLVPDQFAQPHRGGKFRVREFRVRAVVLSDDSVETSPAVIDYDHTPRVGDIVCFSFPSLRVVRRRGQRGMNRGTRPRRRATKSL